MPGLLFADDLQLSLRNNIHASLEVFICQFVLAQSLSNIMKFVNFSNASNL